MSMNTTLVGAAAALFLAGNASAQDLGDLSLEQLTEVQVVTPSRRWEALFDTPAAVTVITAADIRRTGVRTLPDALRLAPGVEVAQDGHDSWSISMRGFNDALSNKLLVLIDGRTVYSPLFAGVFWDVQNVMIEDIDRIEVIAGPAGTMWGANAVNGVINIMTRPALETTGGLVAIAGDTPWRSAAVRYGARINDDTAARAYLRYFERSGRDHLQAGFRMDAVHEAQRHTLQGDVYDGNTRGIFRTEFELGTLPAMQPGATEVRGHNLLYRWNVALDGGGAFRLRAFYDHTQRDIPGTFHEERDTYDVDVQGNIPFAVRHELMWGAGARLSEDRIDNTSFAAFHPDSRAVFTLNAFVQDTITFLPERLLLTVGTKVEHNNFSDTEWQPQTRLEWRISADSMAWAAVSRAVRVPSRLDADLMLTSPIDAPGAPFPTYAVFEGSDAFESEELTAYELGYRFRSGVHWSFDAAAFHHDYDRLQVTQALEPFAVTDVPLPYAIIPARLANGMEGTGRGATLAANWSPTAAWRVQLHYSRLDLDLRNRPGFDSDGPDVEGNSPENQYALRVFADLRPELSLYAGWRHVDALPNAGGESYDTGDISIRWAPSRRFELSIRASNLGGGHVEFEGFEVEPALGASALWRF